MAKYLVIFLLVLTNQVYPCGGFLPLNESLQFWTLGSNQPEINCGIRGDGSTGNYHYLPVGTSAYYYETMTEGIGSLELWIYDPGKCTENPNPGYNNNGPCWGLQTPLYQVIGVGIFRQSFIAGCQGYSPWSTVAPYSPGWFKDGIRNTSGVPWTPGWYKWFINGQWNSITFTLCNVTYCITDGPPDDDVTTGDCAQTYDATTYAGAWAAVFGYGWKALWLKGDDANGIEDISAYTSAGDGLFAEFCGNVYKSSADGCAPVSKYYKQSTWGNIKAMHR